MDQELDGWVRPRPVRVAFLVQDGEHSATVLDGIFADCYSRWGGRFSILVPCLDGKVPDLYWPWLETFDPDIVYSYVTQAAEDELLIHERLSPALYHLHVVRPGSDHTLWDFRPNLRFNILSSLSTIFRISSSVGPSPLQLIDVWHTENPSRFLTDNFGTFSSSHRGSMFPLDATPYARPLIVVPDEKKGKNGVPADLNSVPTEADAFNWIARRKATCVALCSIQLALKLEIPGHTWGASFNLVVGETFEDRLLFWNARLRIPAWLDHEFCCLRVSADDLRRPEFVATLCEFLRNRNHVNAGSGGQSQVTLRSTSVQAPELEELRKIVESAGTWGMVRAEHVTSLDAIVPDGEALKNASLMQGAPTQAFSPADWKSFVWVPPNARPPVVTPHHLLVAPPRQGFASGFWANDLAFEFDEHPMKHGQRNHWELSRRWRMASAFNTKLVGSRFNNEPPAPRTCGGRLAAFVSLDHPIESVVVPTILDAMRQAMVVDGLHFKSDPKAGQIVPQPKAAWMQPSSEAGYLEGVLGLFGGYGKAAEYLLHPFLSRMFAELGGDPSPQSDVEEQTLSRIVGGLASEAAFDLRSDKERRALASLIAKAAKGLKKPSRAVRLDKLESEWAEHRAAYWEANPSKPSHPPEEEERWERFEEESLDACLQTLRRKKVLFQGYEWTCSRCYHHNWVDMSELAPTLECEVCQTQRSAPVKINWVFRPNEFLIESLRDHSVLSSVWLLDHLSMRSHDSFQFLGPRKFGDDFDEPLKARSEIDLMVLSDGKAVACEIKSSWTGVRVHHLKALEAFALRMRPDRAVFAVMEPGLKKAQEIAAMKSTLEAAGISFELIVPGEHEYHGGPHLPHDE